jgi:hypothetical protein
MRTQSVVNPAEVDKEISITWESKKHEDLATMVECKLREHFGRQNIWVIPEQQNSPPHGMYPCVRVVDTNSLKGRFNSQAYLEATQLVPQIYGSEKVHVSIDNVTVDPEGDGLKYVIDHMLSLQFGHRDYFTNFFRIIDTNSVEVVINDLKQLGAFEEDDDEWDDEPTAQLEYVGGDAAELTAKGYAYPIPNEVVLFVFKIVREFRPDLEFTLSTEVKPIPDAPDYAPGYSPAQ